MYCSIRGNPNLQKVATGVALAPFAEGNPSFRPSWVLAERAVHLFSPRIYAHCTAHTISAPSTYDLGAFYI